MPAKDPKQRKATHEKWLRHNQLRAIKARGFRRLPPFLGSTLVTRVLVALTVNGPARKVDFFRTVATNYPPLQRVLAKLSLMGVICKHRFTVGSVFFLNPRYQLHAELVSYCLAIARDFDVPHWDACLVPKSKLSGSLPPAKPNYRILGFERHAAQLLFLYASHGACRNQIRQFFNDAPQGITNSGIRRAIDLGIVSIIRSDYHNGAAAVFNPNFRYHSQLMAFLAGLLRFHPKIAAKAKAIASVPRRPRSSDTI